MKSFFSFMFALLLTQAPALSYASVETEPGEKNSPALLTSNIGGEARAQLIALQTSVISAELNARIASLPWREGQSVKAGQALVKFDCRSYQAQLSQAKAQQKEADAAVDVLRRLSNLQATSELEEQQAQARLEQAQAEVTLREVLVGHCEIPAPFSGRIGEVYHHAHEVVGAGEKLLALVNDRELEVEMIVPSSSLQSRRPGTRFTLHLDELETPLNAEVTRTAGLIDPVSQSVKIFGRLHNPPPGLLPGMSGKVLFEAQ